MRFILTLIVVLVIGDGDSNPYGLNQSKWLLSHACPVSGVIYNMESKEVFAKQEGVLPVNNYLTDCGEGEGSIVIKSVSIIDNKTGGGSSSEDGHGLLNDEDGMFRISGDYYHSEKYCILGFNTTHADIQFCAHDPCKSSEKSCIPKCCGVNEVFEFDSLLKPVCRASKTFQWQPVIYENPYEISQFNVTEFRMEEYYYKKYMSNCTGLKKLPGRNISKLYPHWKKAYWRFLSDGRIKFLNGYRTWEVVDSSLSFCVDGMQHINNNSTNYSGDEQDQILLICERGSAFENIDLDTEGMESLLYCVLCYISAFFYLLTTLVYLILLSKSNSNVWTMLGYLGSLLALKSLVGTCHLINYLSVTNPMLEIELETWKSWGLAITTHFFVLSAYVWIVLMSFDLMRTIRSRTLISTRGRKCWVFFLYCLVGWGLPALTIVVFIVLDHVYADPITEVRVPEYGVYNFFIPLEAQGPYMYYIITGILLFNLIFVFISLKSLLHSSRRNSQAFEVGESAKSTEYISFKLFIKLLILTGSLWFLEIISWLHAGQTNPWYYVVTDIIVQLQSVWTFVILVCNSRTLLKLRIIFNAVIESTNRKIADTIPLKFLRRISDVPSPNSIVTTL